MQYKGKGEHSVNQLEKIIESREIQISELKQQKYKMLEILKELTELKSSSFLLDELQERAKQLITEVTEL